MNIQSFNKQATAAGEKGLIFFHLKPLKSVCQSKSRIRPPQTTARRRRRLVENDEAGKGHKLWVRAGVRPVSWGYIRCGGGSAAAGGSGASSAAWKSWEDGGARLCERSLPDTPPSLDISKSVFSRKNLKGLTRGTLR
jgi:hypothetical protein